MNLKIRQSNINSIKIVKLIEIKSLIGVGTPDDKCREITEYYDFNGNRLAIEDSNSNLTCFTEEWLNKCEEGGIL